MTGVPFVREAVTDDILLEQILDGRTMGYPRPNESEMDGSPFLKIEVRHFSLVCIGQYEMLLNMKSVLRSILVLVELSRALHVTNCQIASGHHASSLTLMFLTSDKRIVYRLEYELMVRDPNECLVCTDCVAVAHWLLGFFFAFWQARQRAGKPFACGQQMKPIPNSAMHLSYSRSTVGVPHFLSSIT